jgi:hypothetical protein
VRTHRPPGASQRGRRAGVTPTDVAPGRGGRERSDPPDKLPAMPARSARRPVPALVFLLALAVLAVVVWVRVADRDSSADVGATNCAQAPQLPANSAVTVTVLNGNGATGLASQVLDAFAAYGFAKGNVGDADPLPGYATVTSGPNATAAALLVSLYLPESTVTQDTREDSTVTVTVGQKFISLSTLDQVKAAMVKAQVSQTPAAPSGSASGASTSPSPTATCTTTPPVPTPSVSSPPAS